MGRLIVATLPTAALAACVIVSSSTTTPPGVDAGRVDGRVTPPSDVPRADVPGAPVLTREQATAGLLASIGANIVLPTYRELATAAATLEAATAADAAAPSATTLAAAQGAWIDLMSSVERAELLQLGPAGMAIAEVLGGQGLRDAIYFFPANRCHTNIVVERRIYDDLDELAREAPFARGLAAIEYQLFEESTEHGCDPGALVRVDDAAWAALGPDGIRLRRAEAAHADARLVRRAADALLAAWSPEGGDFAGQLARAGSGPSVYPTSQAALNAIYWAMYYADRAVKDMKLGVPTGLSALCGADACPELLESRWAGRSIEHLRANLDALEQLFLGGPAGTDAIGFDDLLRAIGQDALATDIAAAISAAVARANALAPVDAATFAANEPALEEMHAAVRVVTELLKVDFASVLSLSPPPGAGEDDD